jgi:hypothetical protein
LEENKENSGFGKAWFPKRSVHRPANKIKKLKAKIPSHSLPRVEEIRCYLGFTKIKN